MEFDIASGEIILVKLAKELALCQFERTQDNQVFCLYKQKTLRVRKSNIVIATKFIHKSDYEFQTFKNNCQNLVEKIDIESLWQILENQNKPFTLHEITDLYFSEKYDAKSIASMAMLLYQDKYYFTYSNDKYLPNIASDVQKIKDFHRKSIEDKEDIINDLSQALENA